MNGQLQIRGHGAHLNGEHALRDQLARAGTEVTFETPFLQNGRTVRGVIQGDSVPQAFIPLLADHMMAGRFPVERMVTFYDLAGINGAAAESSNGTAIKPVIRMPH